MGTFLQKMIDNNAAGRYACGGLDPLDAKVPTYLKEMWGKDWAQAWEAWTFKAVLHSAEHAAAYKPNMAFYLSHGHKGIKVLERLCEHIREKAPHALLILDAKCGDIGDTNEGYAKFAFDVCGADAVTVHPYMGPTAMEPIFRNRDKGAFILCKTSNPGSGMFQALSVQSELLKKETHALYEEVALSSNNYWGGPGQVGLVAGATYPGMLGIIRKLAPNTPLLIPGIGKQGGDLDAVLRALMTPGSTAPFIINQSSTFLCAADDKNFYEASAAVLKKLNEDVATHLQAS